MKSLDFDVTGEFDIQIVNGDIQFIENGPEVRQRVVMHFKTSLDELWTQPGVGVPYLVPRRGETSKIIGKLITLDEIADILSEEALKIPQVEKVLTLEIDNNTETRKTDASIEVDTPFGQVDAGIDL